MFVNKISKIQMSDKPNKISKINGNCQILASHFLFGLWKGSRNEESGNGPERGETESTEATRRSRLKLSALTQLGKVWNHQMFHCLQTRDWFCH